MSKRFFDPRTLISAVFAVATAVVTYTAFAQETAPTIVVEAARPGRSGTTGAPVETHMAKRVVSYKDISLTTASGVKVLETRIRDAAKSACSELDKRYPITAQGDSTQKCVSDATDHAMAEVHKRIEAAKLTADRG